MVIDETIIVGLIVEVIVNIEVFAMLVVGCVVEVVVVTIVVDERVTVTAVVEAFSIISVVIGIRVFGFKVKNVGVILTEVGLAVLGLVVGLITVMNVVA